MKSSTFSNDLLKLIFNATAIANLADNAGTSPLTNLYVALHTADPTASGLQNASECNYTGYARVAVARTSGGWTVTGASVSPVSPINFGLCTAGAQTATHWSVGVAASGATKILHTGAISPTIPMTNGVTSPQLTAATAVTEA